jgi:hypothetical protein
MVKRTSIIKNLWPTFLCVPVKGGSVPVVALGQSGVFPESKDCPELQSFVRREKVRLIWGTESVSKDADKTGRVEIKKGEKK